MRGFPLQDEGPGMNELFHDLQVEQEQERWKAMIEEGVCPVCGGDCSAANPPVIFCPMQQQVVDTGDELHQILGDALRDVPK